MRHRIAGAILLASHSLAGCAIDEMFINRLSCSMDGKLAFFNSMYGPIGIASKVDAGDSAIACGLPLPAPAASGAAK